MGALGARRWLRVVLYRPGIQFGWLWLAAVAWFCVFVLPEGRWNRTFDAHATGTIESIEVERGAEDPDMLIEYVFRDAHGIEHRNHSIDDDAGRDVKEGAQFDIAYASSEPQFSELIAPGVRSRYPSFSHDLFLVGLLSLVGVFPLVIDAFRVRSDLGVARALPPKQIAERSKRPRVALWFLFVLPAVTLAGIATLLIRYYA